MRICAHIHSRMADFRVKFCANAKVCAALVGTVIGAGFVSGAELVRFFPSQGFVPWAVFCAALFSVLFYALLRLGKKYGGYAGVLRFAFGRFAPAVRMLVLGCSLVLCGSMLAGVDAAVREGFGLCCRFPFFALPSLVVLYFLSGRGMGGVCAVNLALVPLILAFVFGFAPGADYAGFAYSPPSGALYRGGMVLLYTAMNAFLAAPVACDMGANSEGGGAGCIAAAILIGFCAATVLGRIAREGAGAYTAEMPFLHAVGGGAAGKLFALVCLCGIFTTLFSSYYPLHSFAQEKKHSALLRAGICAAAFLLSLLGLRGIVSWLYPALGFAGLFFFAACALASWRGRTGRKRLFLFAFRRKKRSTSI